MIDHLLSLDLIRVFDFYLASMFVIGTVRRYALYRATGGLAFRFPGRWPRLLKLMHEHHAILLTWKTFFPSIMTLVVWMLQLLASRLIWHNAVLTARDVGAHWSSLLLVGALGAAMVSLDVYFLIVVGSIDRFTIEGYFDQAEHWLRSWQAPVVRAVTLGFIHPRRMVNDEVQKALVAAGNLIERSMYLTALQSGVRVAFGLSLWFSWAMYGATEAPAAAATMARLFLCCL